MKKNIEQLKKKLNFPNSFISIKGGYSNLSEEMDSNGDGCVNSGDCRGSENKLNCDNKGQCGPKPPPTSMIG